MQGTIFSNILEACGITSAIIRNIIGNNKSSAVAEMGDRLATIDMGQKVGGYCAPFVEGYLGAGFL